MNFTSQQAALTMVTASGITVISSAGAALVGVLFCGSGTGRLQVFSGVTASVPATVTVIAYRTANNVGATSNTAIYYPLAGNTTGGLTVDLQGTSDPRLMLYWIPIPIS